MTKYSLTHPMAIFPRWRRNAAFQRLQQNPGAAKAVAHFQQFVRQAQDHELYRVNPRYLAQQLSWAETQTLDFLILAVGEGLLAFEWEVYCPACGARLQSTREFQQLESHQHCEMCLNEAEIRLDEEITPRVSAQTRLRKLSPARRDQADFRAQVDESLGRLPALHLINRSLFREKLGAQVLPDNHSLGVQHLAVFFSDLKASTQLYQTLGDAAAYQLVRQHFEIVFAAVERHGGAAVKTIGDGVMGTFLDNASALRGVLESVRAIRQLNRQTALNAEQQLRLKVGLNAGPCIVVTLNKRLDYFGSTVNIAARLSDLATGDDIWLAQSVLDEAAARQVVEKYPCTSNEKLRLRGIHKAIDLCRVRV